MTHPAHAFRLAVFDVAGTTVLDGDAVAECLLAVVVKRVPVSMEEVLEVMGLPKPVAIRRLLSQPGINQGGDLDAAVHEAHETFRGAMIERYRHGPIAPAEGAERVFATLRRAGVRVALDTGFSRDILQTILDRLGWSNGVIDFSIASDEVANGRPQPDLIYRAMSMANVRDSSRVAKIGDTPTDMEQGLAARCGSVVGVTYGTHTMEQLSRPGVQTIDRLTDLLPLLGLGAG
ncbi:MAG TPA: HAD hydrolase-like protein [Vicinamibacterales bacterium]|jgi:phosphonatase-like hydrolase|nr:HAD hydrolase-like protein [Vicinamibacterales bacterium]